MKRIYVLRHAKSSRDENVSDHDRPLSRRGIEACAGLARHCAEAGVRPAVVLCSTARRARRTLELVAPGLGSAPRIVHDRAIYLGGEEAILRLLARQEDTVDAVMVVGHNPDLQNLILHLAGGGAADTLARVRDKLPTGALATLDFKGPSWRALGHGSCRLRDLVVPRDLD